jgi:cobyrinic acid a,c-diamide synthase
MRVTLSSKQYNMLRLLKAQKTLTQEQAALYLQPTLTSMAKRGYMTADHTINGVEFHVSQEAAAALAKFESDDVLRSRESSSLSSFLEKYVHRSALKARRAS